MHPKPSVKVDMLTVHRHGLEGSDDDCLDPANSELSAVGNWINLFDPTADEIAAVEAAIGIELPNREELSEVEASSRLRREGDRLYLALPVIFRDDSGIARITPVGLILSSDHLVTIRFDKLKAFATCGQKVGNKDIAHPSTTSIFIVLLEAIVDRLADILEEVGRDLDAISIEVFGDDLDEKSGKRPKAKDLKLRQTLRRVGRARQLSSKVRMTLLGIGRIVPFVQTEADWLPAEAKPWLEIVQRDVESLDEFEVHLSDKVQFLLDADLGLINVEQNDRFRILTVVSIVGIFPTLLASMYGMNFKHMPELDWAWGYPYGLSMIALSVLLPIGWFRWRGWL